jgi:hypothetical protein
LREPTLKVFVDADVALSGRFAALEAAAAGAGNAAVFGWLMRREPSID